MMTLTGKLIDPVDQLDQETNRITNALLDKINTRIKKDRDKEKEMKEKIRER